MKMEEIINIVGLVILAVFGLFCFYGLIRVAIYEDKINNLYKKLEDEKRNEKEGASGGGIRA
jgi:hypothetical protein